MEQLLSAVLLYVVVFGADYLFYVKLKDAYSYVSRRTHILFVAAQIAALWYFFPVFKPYTTKFVAEVTLLGVLVFVLFGFAYALVRDRLYVCKNGTRTLRCLTPYYVWVKGSEIVFQELIYLVIALSLVTLMGVHFYTYLTFVIVLLIIHAVVILGGGQRVKKSLTFGLVVISVPIFYVFVEMQLFWPAVYLHAIMYVFYWLTFADFDVKPGENSHLVKNSGKLSG
tara:strand:+ start:907 stop:1584 length:678 start_codon:yes stop_codon:yes gene_type:complete